MQTLEVQLVRPPVTVCVWLAPARNRAFAFTGHVLSDNVPLFPASYINIGYPCKPIQPHGHRRIAPQPHVAVTACLRRTACRIKMSAQSVIQRDASISRALSFAREPVKTL